MIERGKSDYKGWTPAEMPFDTYCVHDLDGMPKRFGLELELNFIIISHVTSIEQLASIQKCFSKYKYITIVHIAYAGLL